MDPRRNPYAPGAGTRPPELAGRDPVIEQVDIALDRVRLGRSAQYHMLIGLLSCPLLSGPSTMTVWIEEGTTDACEEAQA